MSVKNPNNPTQIYGRHKDETIIVLGNSASLNGMDLDEFDCFTTLGVNRILRMYEPTYVMVVDHSVIRAEAKRLSKFEGDVLIFPGSMSSAMKSLYKGPWISTGLMTSNADPCAKKGPLQIPQRGNSAYEAAQIAMRMGASRIALAGVDLYWPPGKDTHFFGSGKKEGCSLCMEENLISDFANLKKSYGYMGIEIVSISPWKTPFRDRIGYIPIEEL